MKLLGASEAADLLDVEVPRITRWRHSGKMPAPVAHLAATPVWELDDVLALRDGETVEVTSPQPLVGTSEAAEMLEVNKSQIGRWVRTGKFPEPIARLAAGPVWEASQIEAFASRL